jgi:hypothetical protein
MTHHLLLFTNRIFFFPLTLRRVYRPKSYRAVLLLQRWQHIFIQSASPLWASHPFPHFHTFLPVLQAPSSLRLNFGRFVGPRDGATATHQGGGNSDIILVIVPTGTQGLQTPEPHLEGWKMGEEFVRHPGLNP